MWRYRYSTAYRVAFFIGAGSRSRIIKFAANLP
jgi:hypothetical protein